MIDLFSKDYILSREAIDASIANESMFNLIHMSSIIKVDFIVRKTSRYRQVEFSRRVRVDIEDFSTWIVSKEDLVLSKLWWAKDSRSEMQLQDIRNLCDTGVDRNYIKDWIDQLDVVSLWEELDQ